MQKKDLKLGDKEVVHCPTEELANKVLQIGHDCGYKWRNGTNFICNNNYSRYEIVTCYDLNTGTYGVKYVYINNNYKIIPAEEFIKRHEKPEGKKRMTCEEYYKDIQVGDKLWDMCLDKWYDVIEVHYGGFTMSEICKTHPFPIQISTTDFKLLRYLYQKVDVVDFCNLPPKPKYVREQYLMAPMDMAPMDMAPLDMAPLDMAPLDMAPLHQCEGDFTM